MIRSGIYTLGIIVLTGILVPAYAQPGTDTTWKRGGNIGINLSQVSLSQWAAGGDNAVGFNLQFNYFANYKKAKHLWNNRLELDYGLNKTKSDGTKKTNDKIYLSSTYGYEIAKNWYASGLMTFQTQFAKGYDYNVDPDVFISRFMSPGYLLIGAGFTWTPKAGLQRPSLQPPGEELSSAVKSFPTREISELPRVNTSFPEFGANLRMEAKYEFLKNMTVFSRLNLYSNYLKDPQNVDISWDVQLNMAINQWFSCNITTNMIYDNDTKILQKDGTKGPRLQFKEALAVGFQVTF